MTAVRVSRAAEALRRLDLTRAEALEATNLAYPIGDNPAGSTDFEIGQTVRLVGETWDHYDEGMRGAEVKITGRDDDGPVITLHGKTWTIFSNDTYDQSAELVTDTKEG